MNMDTHEEEDTETEGRQAREDEGRYQRCCHKSRNAWGFQKLEDARKDPPLEALEGEGPC